jgi:hypothetical protein
VIGLSLGIQAYVLYYAFHYGVLSGLLQWDDCAVILRGFENLAILAHTSSIVSALHGAIHFNIHAPISDAQTMAGLLLSGGQIWGPYLLSAAWLALVLIAILKTLDRRDWALAAATTLFILVQPLTIDALTYVKSDWKGGLLLVGALFLLNAGVEKARPDLKLFGAGLLGLSILSKLTAFYLPVLALGILLLFEWHHALIAICRRLGSAFGTQKALGPSFTLIPTDRRSFILCATIAVCPFLLFFVYQLRSTISYIRSAIGSSIWQDGLTTLERARFYSPLDRDGWATWGNLHVFFSVFVVAALWVAWRRRNLTYPVSLLIFVVIGTVFFVPLIAVHSSDHSFGATFLGAIMAATLITMEFIARSLPRWGSLCILAITLLIALPTALPFTNSSYYSDFSASNDEIRQLANTYDRVVDTMLEKVHPSPPHIIVLYDHLFAPHPNLAIKYFQKTGYLPTVDRVDELSDIVRSQLMEADFVLSIVPSPDQSGRLIPDLYPAYPISHDPARAEDVIHDLGRFDLIGAFGIRGGEIHLYNNHPK